MIVLDELFANVVDHGCGGATPGSIEVTFTLQPGQLIIDFSDDRQPFDPLLTALPDLDLPVVDRPIGGLGLHILRSLVDDARHSHDCGRDRLLLRRTIPVPDTPERS
jgi:anti-sigma regulatory factor (Ser/Thr protein kinase)